MKIAVVNVPRLEPHRPPPGPAIIANVCKSQGHDVFAFDLNIEFFHYCRAHQVDYYGFDQVWDKYVTLNDDQNKFLHDFISLNVEEICKKEFDWILVSVFAMSAHVFTEIFLKTLRPVTTATIAIGGMGTGTFGLTDASDFFGARLKRQNLIDHYMIGEGEESIVKLLNGQSGPGIDNNQINQIDNLDALLQPNYEFYNLDQYDYLYPNNKEVYITGSRGCVRKCTYCDVERFWPKYRYRSGQNIANEIIDNYERFNITRFYFTDSLVNGSYRAFNDMCDVLSSYTFDEPIKWSGQFIFRQKNTIPKDHFKKIADAGADILYVGIETGSDKIRFEMGKKFTNDDIAFQLEECSRYNIKVIPLMFTGYITETIEDHIENLKFFERWQRFVADGTIVGIELGSTLTILPGTPIERMIDSHGISFLTDDHGEPNNLLWFSAVNPDLTITERIRRKIEIHEAAIKYAWPVWRQSSRLEELYHLIVKNKLFEENKLLFHDLKSSVQGDKKQVIPIKLQ